MEDAALLGIGRFIRFNATRVPVRPFPILSRWLALAALALTVCRASVALAADGEELDYAKSLIDGAQYEEAAVRFQVLLDPARESCPTVAQLTTGGCKLTDESTIWRARSYYALALALLDRKAEAKSQFKLLLKQSPTFIPSPAIFPQKTIELFLQAKSEVEADLTSQALLDQQRKSEEAAERTAYLAYVTSLENLASKELVVSERSRWLAALPFGVGQFVNDNTALGVFFLSIEVAALGASVGTFVGHSVLSTCGTKVRPDICGSALDPVALEEQVDQLKVANIVSTASLAALMIAGVIEAQVNFAPSVEKTRVRKLPQKPATPKALTVTGVPDAPDAVGLGVQLSW